MSHPRELLNTIVWSASKPEPSASRNMQQVCTVPANLIEVARDLLRGPTPEGKRYLKNLMRAKYYGPNKATGTRWRIVKRETTRDDLVLLGQCGLDFAVFTFWLPRIGPKMCPEDKFTYGRKEGEAMFADKVKQLNGEPKLALCAR